MANWNINPEWVELANIMAEQITPKTGVPAQAFNSWVENIQYCKNRINDIDNEFKFMEGNFNDRPTTIQNKDIFYLATDKTNSDRFSFLKKGTTEWQTLLATDAIEAVNALAVSVASDVANLSSELNTSIDNIENNTTKIVNGGTGSFVAGYNANNNNNNYSVVIGANAETVNATGIAIGRDAKTTGEAGVAIGSTYIGAITAQTYDGVAIAGQSQFGIAILGTSTGSAIAIGGSSEATMEGDANGVSIGKDAKGYTGIAIGQRATTKELAIGTDAKCIDNGTIISAIQIGTGINSNPNTVQIKDYQLLDSAGHIPNERIPEIGSIQTILDNLFGGV